MKHDVADNTAHQGQPVHAQPLRLIKQCSNQRRGESGAINGNLVRHINLSRRSEGPIKDKSSKRTQTTAYPPDDHATAVNRPTAPKEATQRQSITPTMHGANEVMPVN